MNINNQNQYWDSVANTKTFTHPLDFHLIDQLFTKDFSILDYGCGYGRICKELESAGFHSITGVDSSRELIKRGKSIHPTLKLQHISSPSELENSTERYDAIILFAVLTCIPSNTGQKELIRTLSHLLKPKGLIYISDYYLQNSKEEVKEYQYLNGDQNNYGTFSLPEGATFRHHTQEWIMELIKDFKIVSHKMVDVKTMNGHSAEAFQMVVSKGEQE